MTLQNDIKNLEKLEAATSLKKEADVQFAKGALQQAFDMYTQALDHVQAHAGCLSNRAACRLAMHDEQGCVDDCSAALELLGVGSGPVAVTARAELKNSTLKDSFNMLSALLPGANSDRRKAWLLKTHVRRGAVLLNLKQYKLALEDYNA
eukprot:CAMPEP_0182420500 /NCGR_PEP_ID=MMETSP1167-20130531/5344_1 /TAXON_ID=2988 /ORGANISM="Mallomonas Sp, Strain CCMP3275" /LENGTH=149 /DNA_ID=CAMNT_0024596519 /DNA_START=202 /DNA_END=647 /DNA_ORIENTATION=-